MPLVAARPVAVPAGMPIDVDTYYRMAREGLIGPDEQVELLEGEIVRMPPIGPTHADVVDELGLASRWVPLETDVRVRIQGPICLDRFSEPQPDIAVLRRRPEGYRRDHPTAADVLLLIEVADSTLLTDRSRKVPLYARHGVPEVWLVNLPAKLVEVYRQPAGDAFGERHDVTEGILRPLLLPDLELDVAALFA